ncbi:hypothetical protein B9479_008229 [Cryptococcus floricola]|uniref:Uncharacterized protein n=1 Tax=Cryptococcus floricola TaxID=2591691 RepID=A0A5D3AMF0_9TREE|nr:hypothetical protein B9479_008229 [Cryptococcus floricola]
MPSSIPAPATTSIPQNLSVRVRWSTDPSEVTRLLTLTIGSGDVDMGEEAPAPQQTAPGGAVGGGGGAKEGAVAQPKSSVNPAPDNSSVPVTTPRKRTNTDVGNDSEKEREQVREEEKRKKLLGWKEEVLALGLPEARPRATRFVSDKVYEDSLVILSVSRLGAGRQLPLSRLVARELFLKSTLLPASSIVQVEAYQPGELRSEVLVAIRPTLSSAAGFRRLLKHKGVVYDASSSSCFLFSVFPLVRPLVRLELRARPLDMSFGQAKKALEGFKSPFPSSNFPIGEPPLFSRIDKFKAGDLSDAASATFMAAVNWDLLKGVPEGLVSARAAETFQVAWARGCDFCGGDHPVCPIKLEAEHLLAHERNRERIGSNSTNSAPQGKKKKRKPE